jgi:hypothetical protein
MDDLEESVKHLEQVVDVMRQMMIEMVEVGMKCDDVLSHLVREDKGYESFFEVDAVKLDDMKHWLEKVEVKKEILVR